MMVLAATLAAGPALGQSDTARVNYRPQLHGVLKTKFEVSLPGGDHRFNVRNSRVGVRGHATRNMRYAVQIELSSEGKLEVLDSYIAYRLGSFELSVGQQGYEFSTELDRGGTRSYFANRSFIAKFITQYEQVRLVDGLPERRMRSIGSRDIGALVTYRSREGFPWGVWLGVFNGEGINNPEWSHNINVVARLTAGRDVGFSGAASYYAGNTPLKEQGRPVDDGYRMVPTKQRLRMWNLEARYADARWIVEAEFAQRILHEAGSRVLSAAVVQGLYRIPLSPQAIIRHVAPMLRWDYAAGVCFVNKQTDRFERLHANRLTFGLTFGLTERMLRSEIRLNYEQYLFGHKPGDYADSNLFHNKFTVEFVAAF